MPIFVSLPSKNPGQRHLFLGTLCSLCWLLSIITYFAWCVPGRWHAFSSCERALHCC